jgi:beta-glucosidase
VLTGQYNPLWFKQQGVQPPDMGQGDLAQISRPLNFVALNVYSGSFARALADGNFETIDVPQSYPTYNIGWLRHTPDCLYWTLRFVQELAKKPLYISENGCCAWDALNAKGECLDVDRVEFLRAYLRAAHRAVQDGVDLRGYFQWTLLDNFEWAEGYTKRFGLYYTDFATQERKAKLSAQWYARVTRENRVM